MTLIYYDNSTPKQSLYKMSKVLKNSFEDDVLFIPKEFDVIQKASREQLLSIKQHIEEALSKY
jgi:hypothetical protein